MLTPTQKLVIRWALTPAPKAPRVFIMEGSVRSGKTRAAVNGAYAHSRRWPGGYRPLVGATREVANGTMAPRLAELAGADGIVLEPREVAERYVTGGSVWSIVGAPTRVAQNVLQGRTIAFGILDEAGLLPRRVVTQALARLSDDRSKLVLTLNPENPAHWLNEYLLERDIPAVVRHVPLTENHALSQNTRDFYDVVFEGVDHERYVSGNWVARYGLVYPAPVFADPPNQSPAEITVGIDYGAATPTAAVWLARYSGHPERYFVIDEYEHDGSSSRAPRTLAEHCDEIMRRYPLAGPPVIDPSAAGMRIELAARGVHVLRGNNAVVEGADRVNAAFAQRRLAVASSCRRLRRQLRTVEWDEGAAERGESKQVKRGDHLVDALRYWGSIYLRGAERQPRPAPEVLQWRRRLTSRGSAFLSTRRS